MKKVLSSLFALVVLAMVFASCNKNSPKVVAKKWLTSFYHMDYDGAKALSTEETKKILAIFEQLSVNTPDSDKSQMKKITIDIKDVKEENDKATVTYVTSDNTKEQTIHLVKQNGKWLVQWTKQDQMNGDTNNNGADSTSSPADQPAMSDTSANPPANPAATPQSADTAMAK